LQQVALASYDLLTSLLLYAVLHSACRLLPKQLDARWVASRSLKPQLNTLFKPHEWQPGSVTPQVLLLPSWPTPQQVVQQLLWPGMQQDAE
jgi:hypothetical protein